jgi:hypothetical protein
VAVDVLARLLVVAQLQHRLDAPGLEPVGRDRKIRHHAAGADQVAVLVDLAVDRTVRRQVVARDGQLDARSEVELAVAVPVLGDLLPVVPAAVPVLVLVLVVAVGRELDQALHRALAVAALADHDRAAVVLQRARHDLRGRGREAVDEHEDRHVRRDHGLLPRVELLGLAQRALRRHDQGALGQEQAGDVDGLVEQATGVVAQVEHERLHAAVEHLDQRLAQFLARHRAELLQHDHADLARQHLVLLGGNRDRATLDLDHHLLGRAVDQRRVHAAAPHVQAHLGARTALELLDHLVGGLAERRPLVDAHDLVLAHQAGLVGGAGIDRARDREQAVLAVLADVGADAAVTGREFLLEALVSLRREVARVLVEALQHALHRGVEQLVARDLLAVGVRLLDHRDQVLDAVEIVGAGRRRILLAAFDAVQLGQVLELALADLARALALEVGLREPAALVGNDREAAQRVVQLAGDLGAAAGERERTQRAQLGVAGVEELAHDAARLAHVVAHADATGGVSGLEAHIGRAHGVGSDRQQAIDQCAAHVGLERAEAGVGGEAAGGARERVFGRGEERRQALGELRLDLGRVATFEARGDQQQRLARREVGARERLLELTVERLGAQLPRGVAQAGGGTPDRVDRAVTGAAELGSEQRAQVRALQAGRSQCRDGGGAHARARPGGGGRDEEDEQREGGQHVAHRVSEKATGSKGAGSTRRGSVPKPLRRSAPLL